MKQSLDFATTDRTEFPERLRRSSSRGSYLCDFED